jgi:hypothetical protein
VHECIHRYIWLARRCFDTETILTSGTGGKIPEGRYSNAAPFEEMLKELVKRMTGDWDTLMAEPIWKCRTVVVSSRTRSTDGVATLFRSYGSELGDSDSCTRIWEAAAATLAIPSFFKPVFIREASGADWFNAGTPRYNNPAELVLAEAQSIWIDAEHFCLVSIGTGKLEIFEPITCLSEIFDSRIPESEVPAALMGARLVELCRKLSLNSELVHHRLWKRTNSDENYS